MIRIAKHYQHTAILLVLLLLTGSFAHAQDNVPERLTIEYVKNHYAGMKTVNIPYGVKVVNGFWGNKDVESITIPSSVKEIERSAFEKCSSLKQIKLPSSVTKIGSHAFSGCQSLQEITLPSSVTAIEEWTFYFCRSLRKVTLPKNLKIIGNRAFNACYSLQEITIPSTVTTIEEYAFGDSGLERIVIPRSVNSIGGYAFSECKKLREALVPASLAKIISNGDHSCPIFEYSWYTEITIYDAKGKKWKDDGWYWKCRSEEHAEAVRRDLEGKPSSSGSSSIDPNTVSIPSYEDGYGSNGRWQSAGGPMEKKEIRFSNGWKMTLYRIYKSGKGMVYWPIEHGIEMTERGWKTEADAAAAGYVCRKYSKIRSVGRYSTF